MEIKEILKKPWAKSGLSGAFLAFLIVSVYNSEDRWSALNAIATFSAVMVALFFGLRTEIENNRTSRYRLNSARARIHNRVSVHCINLDWVIEAVCAFQEGGSIDPLGVAGLTRLWSIENITDDDVLELAATYENSHELIQVRERMLAVLGMTAVPKEHEIGNSDYDFQRFYSLFVKQGPVTSLFIMRQKLLSIKNITKDPSGEIYEE